MKIIHWQTTPGLLYLWKTKREHGYANREKTGSAQTGDPGRGDGGLSEKGYEKTTIGDIARELGISQGLYYRYVGSKEEIYDLVIDTYAGILAEENQKLRPENQSIRQWINSIPHLLGEMKKAEKEDARLYTLLHNPQNKRMHRELCWKVGGKLLPDVTKVLEQAKENGEIGLLISGEANCGEAIQDNWRRLLGIQ